MSQAGRLNGFSKPRSTNQTISWAGQITSLALFYPCAIAYLAKADGGAVAAAAGLVAVHGAIVLVSFGLWYFVESHDPAEPSCFSKCLPDSERWTTNKYDRVHKKRIEGLDHFCEWLNTAVGRSNYVPFFLLVCLGFLQFSIQLVFGLLILSAWRKDATDAVGSTVDPNAVTFLLAVGVLVAISVLIALMYAMLLSFHVYLGCRGMSTYDYTMEQQRAYKQQQRLEQTHGDAKIAKNTSVSSAGPAPPPSAEKNYGADEDDAASAAQTDAELGLPSTEMVASGGGESTLDS
jgi:hypothetical protein